MPDMEKLSEKMGVNSQSVSGIAKNMSWKILFFTAACCVLAGGIISLLDLIFTFSWAPFSFTAQVFMLVFGLLMLVLDFPIPHPSPHLALVRNSIYKYLLFMTRFTGRGIWYTFLGTMIFGALFDLNINWFFGVLLGGYVGVLGIVTMCYGAALSRKLNSVRLAIQEQGAPPQCPDRGFSKEGFKALAQHVNHTEFSEDELDYVFNGLSFTPSNDGVIMPDEYLYWISPGSLEIV